MGDGGLRRFRIKDDKADGPSELIRAIKTGAAAATRDTGTSQDWKRAISGSDR